MADLALWNVLYLTCPFCSYMVSSLEMLVAEDYLIVYMNGATPRSKMPGISWLKKCYQMIDRRWEKIRDTGWMSAVPKGAQLDGEWSRSVCTVIAD